MFCLRWIVDRQTERLISHLMKVNCSPYMLVSRARLGYFPNGGTIRLNTRAIHTNTAGRTIWKKTHHDTWLRLLGKYYLVDARQKDLHWLIVYLQYVFIKISSVYLSKEAFPGAPSVEESFPEQCNELLSLQTPAFDLVWTFAICSTEPVGLTGFWTQTPRYTWANLQHDNFKSCFCNIAKKMLVRTWCLQFKC